MVDKLSKLGFSILLISVLFGSLTYAQTPVCNLRIDIFELQGERITTDKVNIVLTDAATKKKIKPLASDEATLFSGITSGEYKIEVASDGFERRAKDLKLECRTVDEILTISKILYLQKSGTKKDIKYDGAIGYAVQKANGQTDSEAGKGVLNGSALVLVKPKYPKAARAVRASGAVQVQVTLDEDGEIAAADAISGHPLLQQAAEQAAKESRFAPTLLEGQPVKVTGIIVYNFVP
jgi:TonB family protein